MSKQLSHCGNRQKMQEYQNIFIDIYQWQCIIELYRAMDDDS